MAIKREDAAIVLIKLRESILGAQYKYNLARVANSNENGARDYYCTLIKYQQVAEYELYNRLATGWSEEFGENVIDMHRSDYGYYIENAICIIKEV